MPCRTEFNPENLSQKTKIAPAAWSYNTSANRSSVPPKTNTQLQKKNLNKEKTEKRKKLKKEKNIYTYMHTTTIDNVHTQ